MQLKLFKPTSPSKRHLIKINNNFINNKNILLLKTKIIKLKKRIGKNNLGKITVRHKQNGHKKLFRQIFFKKVDFIGIVFNIQYDPNRNSNIASIYNIKKNNFFYVVAAKDLVIGNIIKSGFEANKKVGHINFLEQIPIGCCIHNVALKSNGLAKISRSAGTYSIIIKKTKTNVIILLSSGQQKKLPLNAFATIGIVSNELHFLNQLGKAGRSRWLGKRPTVRGVAMNPVDHPNGGGEGRKSGKRKTPWGKTMNSFNKKQ